MQKAHKQEWDDSLQVNTLTYYFMKSLTDSIAIIPYLFVCFFAQPSLLCLYMYHKIYTSMLEPYQPFLSICADKDSMKVGEVISTNNIIDETVQYVTVDTTHSLLWTMSHKLLRT